MSDRHPGQLVDDDDYILDQLSDSDGFLAGGYLQKTQGKATVTVSHTSQVESTSGWAGRIPIRLLAAGLSGPPAGCHPRRHGVWRQGLNPTTPAVPLLNLPAFEASSGTAR